MREERGNKDAASGETVQALRSGSVLYSPLPTRRSQAGFAASLPRLERRARFGLLVHTYFPTVFCVCRI